ncbi:hypothetical protein ACIA4C_09460 [Lactobacillus delbrueckii subsp. allosunkii]
MGKAFKKFAKDKALKVKRGAGRPVFQSKKAKRQGFKLNQGVVLAKEGSQNLRDVMVSVQFILAIGVIFWLNIFQ